jgi:sarcosine oxidase subunit gamma
VADASTRETVSVVRADRALVQVSSWRTTVEATREAFRASSGFDLPIGPRTTRSGDLLAVGLSAERWMIVAPGSGEALAARLATALDGLALVTDQSDARGVFAVAGPRRLAMLETVLPLDLHPRAFPADGAAVTEMAGLSAIVWTDPAGDVIIAVPRSMEEDAAALLGHAAAATAGRPPR